MNEWTNLEIAAQLTHRRTKDGGSVPVIKIVDAEQVMRQMRDEYERELARVKAKSLEYWELYERTYARLEGKD
jgi:hypothetical protein